MSEEPTPRIMDTSAGLSALDPIVKAAAALGASDVHLSAGRVALIRVDGELVPLPGQADRGPAGDWLEAVVAGLLGARGPEFQREGEADLAFSLAWGQRIRVNVFRHFDGLAASIRLVPQQIPSLVALGVPEAAAQLALRPHGLVLVTGPTGSGKSTTLAAMIELINQERAGHIVTLEDPIEYLHEPRRCLIHQREIGTNSLSFASALRHVLRQDPDVLMIGELRDPESIASALTAAETGHLVLATLHTQGAAKSLDRILDSFPSSHQNQVRAQLGETLQGVVSQVLLPRRDGSGRVLATEVLLHTDAVGNLIREGQLPQLQTVMQTSARLGMHTLDQSLQNLVRRGTVSAEIANEHASHRDVLAGTVPARAFGADTAWGQTEWKRTV